MKRMLAWGGVVGPTAFIAAWLASGLITSADHSMLDDAISRSAAMDADTRTLMTSGFVAFGLALPAYAVALRTALPGRSWLAAAITGGATLAVAVLPLDHSDTVDRLHGVAAAIGYVALAVTPALAVGPLRRRGRHALATAGVVAVIVSAVALPISLVVDANGLFQRIGLTATDLWLIASVPTVLSLLATTGSGGS